MDTLGFFWPKLRGCSSKISFNGCHYDQLLPMDEVTIFGLEHFKSHYPKELQDRYKQMNLEQEAPETEMTNARASMITDRFTACLSRMYEMVVWVAIP